MLGFEQSRPLIKPNKRALLRKVLRGNEYDNSRELELNYNKGTRGWQIKVYNKQGEAIRRFCFTHEIDVIEFFIEIHDPGFSWWYHDINPLDVDKVLLLITQSLTTGAGGTQTFSVPVTWGNNTVSCIGGGGQGGSSTNGLVGSGQTCASGGGGGGGAFAQSNNLNADRTNGTPYFIGSQNQATWFNNSSLISAAGANSATLNGGGTAGLAANSIGTTKKNGGNGGQGITTVGSGILVGAGGGGAGGTTSDGTTGSNAGTTTPNNPGANGGASDTVAGGTGVNGAAGNNGNTGTDFDASHGAGSGGAGGGAPSTSSAGNKGGGAGGLYGGGGGGPSANAGNPVSPSIVGGLGQQGMIFLSWVPYAYSEVYGTN